MAPIKLETAIPDKTIDIRDAPVFCAIAKTISTAIRPPAKAAKGARYRLAGKKALMKTVRKPAPEFTPIILGLARELFNTDCKIAPDNDKEQPASIAAMVRGILTKLIIWKVFELGSLCFKARRI